MRRLLVTLLLVATSCGGTPSAHIVASGFVVRGGRVGSGAIVRTDGPMKDIELRVTFFAGRRELRVEHDRLPFCPPRTDCPWGQTLFADRLGGVVDRVEVTIVRWLPVARVAVPRNLETRRAGTDIIVQPDGIEGTAYLIAFAGAVPRLGRSFFIRRGERRQLHLSRTLFPLGARERAQTYLYPGRVPARVFGPTD